jgi:urocanate hydratase
MLTNTDVSDAMQIHLDGPLPPMPAFKPGIRRAPDRGFRLSRSQTAVALKNALRYVPAQHHAELIPEFLQELKTRGRIYGYRFRPRGGIRALPIDRYRGNCLAGRAFQLMMDNNLDLDVALYPYELVTYGETGSVCQNWMQFRLIKKYLEALTEDQTLVVQSGHPLGLFRSGPDAPRAVITNGLMVGLFDNPDDWEIAAQMGVSSYGQMTAGGWMYIGPQGIVHGTYNTLLGAGRKMCGVPADGDLAGLLFVSSGLGGMSGAQPKAAEISGAVSVIAEVDRSRIDTRHRQGWVNMVSADLDEVVAAALKARDEKRPLSVAYHGNVVDLLQYLVDHKIPVDLLSDQTSCHVVYDGGYCPQGLSFAERTRMLAEDRQGFRQRVDASLKTHIDLIRTLTQRGAYFFDYGNAFLKAVFDAGVTDVARNGRDVKDGFVFPSYFEDIMGPIFDYGYGPFRWVCLSGDPQDLEKTDRAPWPASIPAGVPRTGTTMSGSVMRAKTAWWWAARRDPLPGCSRSHAHRPGLQRHGEKQGGGAHHAGPGPPRSRRHRFAVPRDGQYHRWQQRDRGHGHPLLCRKRRPGHVPGGASQRRRYRHRQGHQRRLRPGAGRQPAGG